MPQEPQPRDKNDTVGKLPLRRLAEQKEGALNIADTVETAGIRMRAHQPDLWPVADDCKLVGMVEGGHPDRKISGNGHDPKNWKVGQIMSRDVVFCYEDQDCATARKLMEDRALLFLPVVDREMRIVGIFSREEIEEKVTAPSPRKAAAGQ